MAGSKVFLSSKAVREVSNALTARGFFGVPRYTTVLLPPIPGTGAIAFDTTTTELKIFDGSTWTAVGGGALEPGTTTVTGATNAVLYADGSSVLQADSANLRYQGNFLGHTGPSFTVINDQAGGTTSLAGGDDGGSVLLEPGNASSADTAGGNITANAADGTGTGVGGTVSLKGGAGGATADGGPVNIQGGTGGATSGTGGTVSILAGLPNGGANGGNIDLYSGGGTSAIRFMQASPVHFMDSDNSNYLQVVAGANHTANQIVTLTAGTNLVQALDAGGFIWGTDGGNSGLFYQQNIVRMLSTGAYTFSSSSTTITTAADAGIQRDAERVVKVTDGSGTRGWLQTVGDQRLANSATNATTTPSDLSLSGPGLAGRTYSIEIVLFFDESVAADGAVFDLDGSTLTATDLRGHWLSHNDTALLVSTPITALGTDHTITTTTNANGCIAVFRGTITVNGAGVLTPRFWKSTNTTGTLTVRRGSYMHMRDIA